MANTPLDGMQDLSPTSHVASRRRILAAAAAAAGGVGVSTLMRSETALGDHTPTPPFDTYGYINVKEFGAAGSGFADDVQEIQNAINAASNNGGGVVWFPPGEYRVSTRINCREGVHLRGAGSNSVLRATDNSTDHVIGCQERNVTVSDLVLDGNWPFRQTALGSGKPNTIRVHDEGGSGFDLGLSNIHIHRCEIRNNPGFGVFFVNVTNGSVRDCWIHDTGRAGDEATQIGGDGINVFLDSRDIVIAGNLIENNTDDSIGLNSEGFDGTNTAIPGNHKLTRVAIVGNVIAGGPNANGLVSLHGVTNTTVSGNVLVKGQSGGVTITSDYQTASADITVVGNTLIESGAGAATGAGVVVSGAPASFVRGTDKAGCSRIIVQGNSILNPRFAGVMVTAAAGGPVSDVKVVGNTIMLEESTSATINAFARGMTSVDPAATVENLVVAENDIRGGRDPGVLIQGSNHRFVEVSRNRIFNSGTGRASPFPPGLQISAVDSPRIKDNLVTDTRESGSKTQERGLALFNPTGNVEIVGNDFTGNRATLPVQLANPQGATRLRIRDNIGWSPWVDEVQTDDAPWSTGASNGLYYKDKAISFGAALPPAPGRRPRVLVTARANGTEQTVSASVVSITNTGATVRCWVASAVPPSSSVRPWVQWVVEPYDP
jgi:hypothetical protein